MSILVGGFGQRSSLPGCLVINCFVCLFCFSFTKFSFFWNLEWNATQRIPLFFFFVRYWNPCFVGKDIPSSNPSLPPSFLPLDCPNRHPVIWLAHQPLVIQNEGPTHTVLENSLPSYWTAYFKLKQGNMCRYLFYAPPAYECGTRPFLRWVLSQGRSPTWQAVPKMPQTPSAFPFSGRLRLKAWGDGPLRPEVMYPVVKHTRTNCAARNHSRSRAPHHRTQSNAAKNMCQQVSPMIPPHAYGTEYVNITFSFSIWPKWDVRG